MNLETFKKQYSDLLKSIDTDESQASLELKNCTGCVRCHFCTNCEMCTSCTYASNSQHCTHCNRIDSCTRSHRSSHLDRCIDCVDSQYLIDCTNCVDCTYCLGCVGLTRKEFHILNEPYDRKTYFKILKELGFR